MKGPCNAVCSLSIMGLQQRADNCEGYVAVPEVQRKVAACLNCASARFNWVAVKELMLRLIMSIHHKYHSLFQAPGQEPSQSGSGFRV